jgi:hypothetical protein
VEKQPAEYYWWRTDYGYHVKDMGLCATPVYEDGRRIIENLSVFCPRLWRFIVTFESNGLRGIFKVDADDNFAGIVDENGIDQELKNDWGKQSHARRTVG